MSGVVRGYSWLIWDADGTLFDYDRAEAAALQTTFGELGLPWREGALRAYRRINARIWREFELGEITQERLRTRRFELLFGALQTSCDPELFSLAYLAHLAQGTELVDGAEEVVRSLYGRVGMLILTNGLSEVQRPRVERSAIRNYIADVVISEEVGAAKPDPAIFDVAFARMGWPHKTQVLMVGDSLTSDIAGANAYGIDACWFNPAGKERQAGLSIRYEIARLDELLGIVGLAG